MELKFASIITTYRCGFRCHMCNIWRHPTVAADEITAADLAGLPRIRTINVTGGEPFLREDLEEILCVLRPKTRRLVISTNGYLTDRILEVARKHPWVGIRISVEGLPAENDALRGMSDGFDHAIRTLAELSHLGLKDIGFGITLSDRNARSLIPLYHLAKMMHLEFATAAVHNSFYFHKWDNAILEKDALAQALGQLIDELLGSSRPKDWLRAYFNWGLLNYVRGQSRLLPCKMGGEACFIDPWGDVLPCNGTLEKITLGNLRQAPFEQIWTGPRAREIREDLSRCPRNCWMMGSVAEPIKDNLIHVLRWALARKLKKTRSAMIAAPGAADARCQ